MEPINLLPNMQRHGIDIYVMTNSDPHQSEYMPDHWKGIEKLTGFRGEVATVIITDKEARLWTDSRFFISGAKQLEGTGYQLMKMGIDIDAISWLDQKIKEMQSATQRQDIRVGGDLRVIFGALRERINTDIDLMDEVWADRPSLPKNKVELYDDAYNGEPAQSKIARILEKTRHQPILLSALDEIAWTLNLRGTDIPCTPVFVSYLLLSDTEKTLYIDSDKLNPEVINYLKALGVSNKPYEEAPFEIGTPSSGNPIPLMKALKNVIELKGTRAAMLKDGIVMTRFYRWLEEQLKEASSKPITELDCVQKIIDLRKEQPLYREESFPAIVAWNEHGAMPHYENSVETNVAIKGDGILLIDTGGQYLDGTTDITRTVCLGEVSNEMKRDYTLVLKGHIRLAQAVFPAGTRGDQLDALARYDLWRDGKTYLHGTSHGVGHYLGVHEGPQSVRMQHNPQPLLSGMIISNEPAIYIADGYGIRHENCVLCKPFEPKAESIQCRTYNKDEFGEFMHFETLTLCYFDTHGLVMELLTDEEVDWINKYHRKVYETLAPNLAEEEREWLKVKCQTISK